MTASQTGAAALRAVFGVTDAGRRARLGPSSRTDVTPAIWLAHTRPEACPEPYAFRPERFLDRPPATYAWVPFGGGVRRCLGAAFAEMEIRVVLDDPAPAGAAPVHAGR